MAENSAKQGQQGGLCSQAVSSQQPSSVLLLLHAADQVAHSDAAMEESGPTLPTD